MEGADDAKGIADRGETVRIIYFRDSRRERARPLESTPDENETRTRTDSEQRSWPARQRSDVQPLHSNKGR